MRNKKNALITLSVLGGYWLWRNRLAIQRQVESMGLKTPMMKGSIDETARSVASKTRGKMEHGATLAEHLINQKAGNY